MISEFELLLSFQTSLTEQISYYEWKIEKRNVSDTVFSSGPLKEGCKRGRKTASA